MIDDLYKSNIDNSEEIPTGLGWEDLNRKLKRRLFLRFIPTKFNIYYLLLLISFSGFSAYTGYRNYVIHNETLKQKQKKIQHKVSMDTLKNITDTAAVDSIVTTGGITPLPTKFKKIKPLNKTTPPVIMSTPKPAEQTRVKYIKKTVIIKAPLIEQTDTLKILY